MLGGVCTPESVKEAIERLELRVRKIREWEIRYGVYRVAGITGARERGGQCLASPFPVGKSRPAIGFFHTTEL